MGCKIAASAGYLPTRVVTNLEFEHTLDTTDEWIRSRTGITQRHVAAEGEFCSHMAIEAAKLALAKAAVSAADIDLIIVATTTPDYSFPSVASQVQAAISAKPIAAFDIQAVCSGFVYALHLGRNLIVSGAHKNILIIGAEKMSSLLDYSDRSSCILFGDGAGAIILSATAEDESSDIIASKLYADGKYKDILYSSGGVSTTGNAGTLQMKGPEVFKRAVDGMADVCLEVLEKAGILIDDIDFLVPHQANIRIIDAVGKKLGISDNKVIKTIAKHANCSAASIPLAIAENFDKFKEGDLVLCCAFGAGLTWGALLIRW